MQMDMEDKTAGDLSFTACFDGKLFMVGFGQNQGYLVTGRNRK